MDANALRRHLDWENRSTQDGNGLAHAFLRPGLDEEEYTATAAGSANLAAQGTLFARSVNQLVDQRRRNARGILAAIRPFLPQ